MGVFSLVDVKTVRAKTGLTFMEGSSYDVKIRHHKNVSLDLPAGMNLTKTNTTENNVFVSEGKYGDNNKFNSKLNN